MNLPQTVMQIGFILLMVVPGVVFTVVRRQLRGPTPEDQDFSVRLVNAIAASVVFAGTYLIIFGPMFTEWLDASEGSPTKLVEAGPRKFGLTVLLLAVVVPALLGVAAHLRLPQWNWVQSSVTWILKCVNRILRVRVSSSPSAWDDIAPNRADCFVRVFTGDGYWVGGYIPADQGYVATYPHPRDIFIPLQWKMKADGEFDKAIPGSLGIYIPLTGSERVEWVSPPADEQNP
ncbi:DUF6338 family protein [Rhodococcus qingshengii]|uniref:DUF6338 family protein n=1 Tax=Rhodococcus qingshengii TaxID=334542 RepID=UPI00364F8208